MRMALTSALMLLLVALSAPLPLVAQTQGRGALRPFFYVFLAYGLVWVAIGIWVFLIARRLGRIERDLAAGDRSPPEG